MTLIRLIVALYSNTMQFYILKGKFKRQINKKQNEASPSFHHHPSISTLYFLYMEWCFSFSHHVGFSNDHNFSCKARILNKANTEVKSCHLVLILTCNRINRDLGIWMIWKQVTKMKQWVNEDLPSFSGYVMLTMCSCPCVCSNSGKQFAVKNKRIHLLVLFIRYMYSLSVYLSFYLSVDTSRSRFWVLWVGCAAG